MHACSHGRLAKMGHSCSIGRTQSLDAVHPGSKTVTVYSKLLWLIVYTPCDSSVSQAGKKIKDLSNSKIGLWESEWVFLFNKYQDWGMKGEACKAWHERKLIVLH